METGTLYIIPAALGEEGSHVIPEYIREIVKKLDVFVVEHPKTARHFLRSIGFKASFDDTQMYELNEHTKSKMIGDLIQPLLNGKDVGLLSEAGCPAVADPGAVLIKLAHEKNIRVHPLVGPSSILLALMASGLNGQNFSFVGYLPIDQRERTEAIKKLEMRVITEKQTQIFIEAPYRNNQLLETILKTCKAETILTIATDITLPAEMIHSKPIVEWKKKNPDIHKKPTVFLIGNKQI